jgi:hypothetical protein
MRETISFAHRNNGNGTHDSICRGCFMTVASARDEAELPRHESDHICRPDWPYQATEEHSSRHQFA